MEKFEKGLHEEFLFYGENARKWMRKCELLLPKIEKYRIWEKKRFSSIYVYAYKLAGMSQRKVDESLRIFRKIKDKPALRKVAEEKGLGAVRPVATIATEEDQKFWAEKAENMSRHTLETYIKNYREEGGLTDFEKDLRLLPGEKLERKTIIMQVDLEIAEKLEKLNVNSGWNELMKEYLELREEKLKVEKPEVKKTESRPMPVKIRQYVHKTTNGTCIYPGCYRESEELHHIDRFALSKEHNPDKIKPLCKAHHDLAHRGLIQNEELEPRCWKVRKEAEKFNIKNMIDQLVQAKKKPT
ncbi:MAG: HNH endonuclease signature motif containing protein [Nitrospirota bacterium]